MLCSFVCLSVCHTHTHCVETVKHIRHFHSIYNVDDRCVLQAMWEGLAGKVGHRDQLIIC